MTAFNAYVNANNFIEELKDYVSAGEDETIHLDEIVRLFNDFWNKENK